ncbi:hypothetical protein [Saccharopolyspora rosea]|uniref:Uncharacterized protein n=1 Tax=Saccharopolyspora rosea TaxID=524884 RepID=A0ABW3G241_9PSEU|nr:hypothetical protein [Saccharopolyspora rosea]
MWAVGSTAKGGGSAVHWDGEEWKQVGLAAPGGGDPRPVALKAFGPRDVWAVGGLWGQRGMAQHWDGAQWTDVPVPQEASAPWTLQDVDGTAPDDVWSVGYVSEPYHAVALHWDGRTWQDVPVPDGSGKPGDPEELTDVLAAAPNDVWVGGQFGPRSTPTPFTAHWDGAQWTVVGLGSRTGTVDQLVRVDGQVQLFGTSSDGKPFALRHDGTAWRDVPAPAGNVYSATVQDGGDVLGVGASGAPGYERPYASTYRR